MLIDSMLDNNDYSVLNGKDERAVCTPISDLNIC